MLFKPRSRRSHFENAQTLAYTRIITRAQCGAFASKRLGARVHMETIAKLRSFFLGIDPPAVGFGYSYGRRAFAVLEIQIRFVAAEPYVIARCFCPLLHLPRLPTKKDFVDVKRASIGPTNGQRVDSPLIGYVHDNANVHLMYARPSSLFHLVVHMFYYRTTVR